ncbi:isoprenylcysteine carboxylmethyltransferase family protein [Gymnodinialimonas hymeniacidonis]|uniref:methyltransferase family protein n=1 Tax=Gymnodinialimonas hymeniacidonis TaxID=3126508 RepID=UPI0034C66B11
MKGFPDLPPLWLLLFMGLAWLLARFLPLVSGVDPLMQRLGVLLACVGVLFVFWAALWFWKKKTTIEPHHTPGTLIVEGPYRLSRNPIYLGMVLILSGQVLWLGALSPAFLIPLILAVLTVRFAVPEERALLEAFGEEGQAYLKATRRWL